MLFAQLISQGWQALLRHRLRSALTMLGIVWGLVSVILLLGYGEGVGRSVMHAFLGLGDNIVVFWPGQTSMQAGGQRAGRKISYEYADVEAIREQVPIVKAVSAEANEMMGFKHATRVVSLMTRGVEFPYGQMRRLKLAEGRYFTENEFIEHRRVVILGHEARRKIFSEAPAVGESVGLNGLQFEVIGVLENKIQDSSYNAPDNHCAFIPFGLFRDLKNQKDPTMIVFQPLAPHLDKPAIAAVREVIARRHNFNPKDEKATPEWNTIENLQELTQFSLALDVILGLIGALTLGVGGVGVMNIMLVSVTERTREIGLRKALGARPRHILTQFLLEALVLTFIGGIVGAVVALALANAIPPMPLYSEMYETANHEGDIFLVTSWAVMAVSFVVLSLVGIVSGFWPAWKAARLNPIEALRCE